MKFLCFVTGRLSATTAFWNKRAKGPWIAHLRPGTQGGVLLVTKEISIKDIPIFSSGGHPVQLS